MASVSVKYEPPPHNSTQPIYVVGLIIGFGVGQCEHIIKAIQVFLISFWLVVESYLLDHYLLVAWRSN